MCADGYSKEGNIYFRCWLPACAMNAGFQLQLFGVPKIETCM
jgi:hypothetical protein